MQVAGDVKPLGAGGRPRYGCDEAPVTISRTATGEEEGSEVKQTYDQFVEKIHTET